MATWASSQYPRVMPLQIDINLKQHNCLEDDFEVLGLSAVLEDVVDTLIVLRQMFPTVALPTEDQHDRNEEVCEMQQECHFLFPDDLNTIPEGFAEHVREFQKLKQERLYLEEVMTKLLQEVQTEGTYSALTEALERERLRKIEKMQMHLKSEVIQAKRRRLRAELIHNRTSKKEEIRQMEDSISYLKIRLAEAKVKNAVTERYSEKQCCAQLEQKKIIFEENGIQGREKLEKITQQLEEEERAHVEIQFFLSRQEKDFTDKLEELKSKYLAGIQALDKQIEEKTAEKIQNRNKYLQLRKECDRQKLIIEEDRQQKEAIRIQLENERREFRSIVLIQAWWRAVMVRKFLGEYKGLKKVIKKSKATRAREAKEKEKESEKKSKQESSKKTTKTKKKK